MSDPLAIYLHDHLVGSSFAVELLEKLVSEYAGVSTGQVARKLLEQISTDRKTLEQIISQVGKERPNLNDALGWIAERMSRMKLKPGDAEGIGAFEAFEAISLGILGKRALWETLQVLDKTGPLTSSVDYDALICRANQRFERANGFRLKLAEVALSNKERD